MSIATQVSRITADRDTIREALIDWGNLVEATANLDDCATAISTIENQGEVKAEVKEGENYTIPAGYHNGRGIITGIKGGGNYFLQSKITTPTKTQQSVTADDGYYGLSSVTVNAIPEKYQDVTAVTAAAGDVLATKVFVTASGTVTTGTMPNRGAVNQTLSTTTTSYTVPNGYHNGSGTVKITLETAKVTPTESSQDITPSTGKVLSKVTVDPIPQIYADVTDATADATMILKDQTAYVGGIDASGKAKAEKIVGTMPNNGATGTSLNTTTTSYTIPAGYTTGGTVNISLEEKTATPTTADQTITPTSGKVLSSVTVKGVSITMPTANEILSGKTVSVTSSGTTLGSVTGNIASKAAATYYPQPAGTGTGKGDQTISSGQYLSGTQTIKAVTTSGISAANIKHGVTINVGDARSGKAGNIATATGSFYNDGTTYTLSSVGTAIDMGASSSHRYITTNGLQVIPTATYTASGAVTNADITTYGKLTIGTGIISENEGSISTDTAPTFTQGTISVIKAGWLTTGTKVSGASFANTATSGTTYKDISATTAAPVLKSGDYLYINKGYTDNIKISLAKLVPNGGSASLTGDYILSGYSAYNNDGALVAGSIPTVTTTVYHPSTTDQTIPSKNYTGSTGITIHGVTTTNISAANIKSGVVVKVGDGDDDDRITSVTGTFTKESTNPITAATVLSGKIGWVNGAKVTGTMINRGAKNYSFNALTQPSITIEAGYHNGSGKVNLTADLENALAAI